MKMNTDSTIGEIDRAAAIAELMVGQSHLVWSIAIALLAVEIYLLLRFLATGRQRYGQSISLTICTLMIISTVCYMVSLFYGYRVSGAAIAYVREAASTTETNHYKDAGTNAAVQLVAFVIGSIVFLVAIVIDYRGVSRELAGRRTDG